MNLPVILRLLTGESCLYWTVGLDFLLDVLLARPDVVSLGGEVLVRLEVGVIVLVGAVLFA